VMEGRFKEKITDPILERLKFEEKIVTTIM
jgi:hypothetical protein